jgi:hypothetical protein
MRVRSTKYGALNSKYAAQGSTRLKPLLGSAFPVPSTLKKGDLLTAPQVASDRGCEKPSARSTCKFLSTEYDVLGALRCKYDARYSTHFLSTIVVPGTPNPVLRTTHSHPYALLRPFYVLCACTMRIQSLATDRAKRLSAWSKTSKTVP